jgi:hypothetical protein
MGNCQSVSPASDTQYVFATREQIQKKADELRNKHYNGDRTMLNTTCHMCFCIYNIDKEPNGWATYRKVDWERVVKAAFPERAYVITYDHPNNSKILMTISFVQFPDPFAQQFNPRGEPIGPSSYCSALDIPPTDEEKKAKEKEKKEREKKDTPVGRSAQQIRDDYASKHSEKTEVVETKTTD